MMLRLCIRHRSVVGLNEEIEENEENGDNSGQERLNPVIHVSMHRLARLARPSPDDGLKMIMIMT